jgi:hypothetical protein
MDSEGFWSGWIGLAGVLLALMGLLDFVEGLLAVTRDSYYDLTAEQIIVFDVKTWGWIMMIWGVVVAGAGYALITGKAWARWFTLFIASANLVVQLGFVGSGSYPLWALVIVALDILVIYAVTVRWSDYKKGLA